MVTLLATVAGPVYIYFADDRIIPFVRAQTENGFAPTSKVCQVVKMTSLHVKEITARR